MAKHIKQDSGLPPTSPVTERGSKKKGRGVSKRSLLTLVLALAVAGVAVGGVIAWLTASSDLTNTFALGTVDPGLNEDGPKENEQFQKGDTIKQNVDVTNNGNIPIYVRAQVNIYWIDADGNQLWEEPEEDADYTIEWGSLTAPGWQQGSDGFYYWTTPLSVGDTTGFLIKKIEDKTTRADRQLVCDVAIQGIQAEPAAAVQEAWSVKVGQDGALVVNGQQDQQGGE